MQDFSKNNRKMIERLSAEPIQQKQGLRENHSTFSREVQNVCSGLKLKFIVVFCSTFYPYSMEKSELLHVRGTKISALKQK